VKESTYLERGRRHHSHGVVVARDCSACARGGHQAAAATAESSGKRRTKGRGARADARRGRRGEAADAVKGEHRSVACCRGRFRDFLGRAEPGTAQVHTGAELRSFWDSRLPSFLSSSSRQSTKQQPSFLILAVITYNKIIFFTI
jgi:hypothetical protein